MSDAVAVAQPSTEWNSSSVALLFVNTTAQLLLLQILCWFGVAALNRTNCYICK